MIYLDVILQDEFLEKEELKKIAKERKIDYFISIEDAFCAFLFGT